MEHEIELLKRDNGLMSAQLEQCERQHQQRYAGLEKQSAAEMARAIDEINRKEAEIKEAKGKNKHRKAKLAEKESLINEVKAQRDQLAQ